MKYLQLSEDLRRLSLRFGWGEDPLAPWGGSDGRRVVVLPESIDTDDPDFGPTADLDLVLLHRRLAGRRRLRSARNLL